MPSRQTAFLNYESVSLPEQGDYDYDCFTEHSSEAVSSVHPYER